MLNAVARICEKSSLVHSDPAWFQALSRSKTVHYVGWPFHILFQWLASARQNSRLNRWLPPLALWGTLLLLFLSPYAPSDSNLLLILGAAFLTLLRLFFADEPPFQPSVLVGLVLLYVGLGLVAVGASPFPKLALHGYGKMLVYLLAYGCFLVNLRTRQRLYWAGLAVMASATIVAAYGLYQYYIKVPPLALWDDPTANFKLTRVYSFLGNPNLLGSYLLGTMAVTLFYLGLVPRWLKVGVLVSLGMQTLCCYWTYSRGAWMGMVALFGMAALLWLGINRHWLQQPRIKLWLGIGCLLLLFVTVGVVLSSPALMERLQSLFTGGSHSSNNFRMNVWDSSFRMIQDFWLTGIGTGNKVFQRVYTFYMVTGFYALSTYNVFLEIWVEMGIVGLLAFIWLLLAHLTRCVWGILQIAVLEQQLWWALAATALVALLVHGMVDTILFRPAVQILFWFIVAMISVNGEVSHAKSPAR